MKLIYAVSILLLALMTSAQGLAEDYHCNFTTMAVDFSTPIGIRASSVEVETGTVFVHFGSLHIYLEPFKVTEARESPCTAANAEALWLMSVREEHSNLTTTQLNDGFVTFGRYAMGETIFTQAVRTIDNNSDGKTEYWARWEGLGKLDKDLITYIATHTMITHITPNFN
jgi:hypothetical protein